MTSSSAHLDSTTHYNGPDHVMFGNGNSSNISHIGTKFLSNHIKLSDVLVVPNITKNLLSIRKLTSDSPLDVLFSNLFFSIQNREAKEIIARGKCENGLYIHKQGHQVFLSSLKSSKLQASHELWHNRLGHVSFDIISLLHKLGVLSVTSLLPKPHVCPSCQLSKSKLLPFQLNKKKVFASS